MKKNIVELSYGLDDLMKLKPVEFNWKTEVDSSTASLGFIAQDVQEVIPQLVTTGTSGTLGLNTGGMIPLTIKSIQTINNRMIKLFGTSTLESLSSDTFGENNLSTTDTLVSLVKKALEKLSNTFVDMVLSIKKLVVKDGIEMTDKATGDAYCVEIVNGEFVKTKGVCDSSQSKTVSTQNQTNLTGSTNVNMTPSIETISAVDTVSSSTNENTASTTDSTVVPGSTVTSEGTGNPVSEPTTPTTDPALTGTSDVINTTNPEPVVVTEPIVTPTEPPIISEPAPVVPDPAPAVEVPPVVTEPVIVPETPTI